MIDVGTELDRLAKVMAPFPADIWLDAADLWDKLFEGDSIKDKALIAAALMDAREKSLVHCAKVLRKAGFDGAAYLLLRGDGK